MVNWRLGDLWPLSLRSPNEVLDAPAGPVHLISDLEISKDSSLISREVMMDEVFGQCLSKLFSDRGHVADLTIAEEAREEAPKGWQSLEVSCFQETVSEVSVVIKKACCFC